MINEQIIRTRLFGDLTVYESYPKGKDVVDLTIYHKTPENLYRFYRRDFNDWDSWSKVEVDWNGYIMGARNLRTDYQHNSVEWAEANAKQRREVLEAFIQKTFDDDEVGGYHVERVTYPQEWDSRTDEELFQREHELHTRKGELEKELRDVTREYNLIWEYGDNKWDWADRL